jgi:tetratricopeptide (TPR) repeat protein
MKKDKAQPGATPEQLVEAAKEYLGTHGYESVIKYCDKVLEINEQNAKAYCVRGAMHKAVNDFDAAIEDLNRSIEINPTPLAYSLLGNIWCEKGDFPEAIRNYNKVLEFDPDNAAAINNRAEAYFRMDDYDNAIKDYEKLNVLVPEEPSPYYNCGVCYREKGNLGKAVKYFDKAIELGNRDAHVYKSRGLAYMDLGEYDKAIADFKLVEESGDASGPVYLKAAMKKLGGPDMKKPNGKTLDMDTIIDLEESLQEQCKANNENYNEYLCGKFIGFIKDNEILYNYARSASKSLDDAAQYILIEFAGLIVSCFELPVFKRKETGNDKNDEMLAYIKIFTRENLAMISELAQAKVFNDDDIKREYKHLINKINLQPEAKGEGEYLYVHNMLARYPSRQPCLRERIVSLLFSSETESPLENKLPLVFHFHLIIEFLCEYYFSIDI